MRVAFLRIDLAFRLHSLLGLPLPPAFVGVLLLEYLNLPSELAQVLRRLGHQSVHIAGNTAGTGLARLGFRHVGPAFPAEVPAGPAKA